MSAVSYSPRSGRYAPYKHPNVGFLNSSELLIGSTHSLPLLEGINECHASRTSMESAQTVHAASPRTFLDDDVFTISLPSIRLRAAMDNISDLDLSARDHQQAQEQKSAAKAVVRRIEKSPLVNKAGGHARMRSSFDWQFDTPTSEDQDMICPLQRQPRVQSAARGPGGSEAGAKTNKFIEAKRQQQLFWEREMSKASGCAGHACWASAYAGPASSNCRRTHPPRPQLHKHKKEGPHFWQRVSSKLGFTKLKDARATSDPLPQGVLRTVSHERSVSVPENIHEHHESRASKRSFLPPLGKSRTSK